MFELYLVDTETTGLDYMKNEPVEISIYKLSDDTQKTWCLKPINMDSIHPDALRVNGLKLEDLKGMTQEGRDKYKPAAKILVEIENWLMEDCVTSDDRLLVGQNIGFDKEMLLRLWEKCDTLGTFPFNKKYEFDTMQIELFLDFCKGEPPMGYSLNKLVKKYGIKNEKAHSAAEDVKATVAVFRKQIENFKKIIAKSMKHVDTDADTEQNLNEDTLRSL